MEPSQAGAPASGAAGKEPRLYCQTISTPSSVPAISAEAVLHPSAPVPGEALLVKGLDFEKEPTLQALLDHLPITGFQATQLGRAIQEVERMLDWRPPTEEEKRSQRLAAATRREKRRLLKALIKEHKLDGEGFGECLDSSEDEGDAVADSEDQGEEGTGSQERCRIWLCFTSNMISSGLREAFCFLAKHKMIDAVVTSAGGVEEDLIKSLAPTVVGEFTLKGRLLRKKGWNRIGNLIVPNENYCMFEDWVQPLLDEMLRIQNSKMKEILQKHSPPEELNLSDAVWTPSRMTDFLGEAVGHLPKGEESVLYWCHKNRIPVFCPGLTDGSLGDNIFFHTYRNPGLVIDLAADIRRINDLAAKSPCSGLIILGGGLPKHHACNAHLMKNGAEFAVYINSGNDFDGSDSGATPDEAVSWGKIKTTAHPVKVTADATLCFPLLVAATFAKRFHEARRSGSA